MANKHYLKGVNLEYQYGYYMKFHGCSFQRSYGSKGWYDLLIIMPSILKNCRPLAVQVKNTKLGDYIKPIERKKLLEESKKLNAFVIEVFKEKTKVYVKMEPWNLKGKVYTPEEFLSKFYDYPDPYSWKEWKKAWSSKPRKWHHPEIEKNLSRDVDPIG